jgi:hypothetical protein
MLTVINFVTFQLAWFACVLGAAYELDWLGPAFLIVYLPIHLILFKSLKDDMQLLVIAIAVGFIVDCALVLSGAMSFPLDPASLYYQPFWMAALWGNFALTLRHSLAWLTPKPLLATAFGALGGPAAYFAGDRLGALIVEEQLWYSLLLVGVAWAAASWLLFYLADQTPLEPKHPEPEPI